MWCATPWTPYWIPGTIEMLSASHSYELEVREGGALAWIFDKINLPDSNSNEPESHGYINFRVKLERTLEVGDEVANQAFIYFDFNPPILTNFAYTTVGTIDTTDTSTSVAPTHGFGTNNLKVFPNPNSGEFQVQLELEQSGRVDLHLVDLQGRTAWSKQVALAEGSNRIPVRYTNLPAGIYLLCVRGDFGDRTMRIMIRN